MTLSFVKLFKVQKNHPHTTAYHLLWNEAKSLSVLSVEKRKSKHPPKPANNLTVREHVEAEVGKPLALT